MRLLLLTLLAGSIALAAGKRRGVCRIRRISRVVADLDRAGSFYCDGLGFQQVSEGPLDPMLAAYLGAAGGGERVLRLGADEIALVRLDTPGPAYPPGSRSDDAWFQHLAIVVSDMDAAYARLRGQDLQAISTQGPARLPARNGGVTAFKFRDPDGHPLELIHFPPGQGRAIWHNTGPGPCLGIDHSALAVRRPGRSLRHYRRLGFRIATRSLNSGPAQARLDGLPGAQLHVFGLRPRAAFGPGLELLAYMPPGRPKPPGPLNAIATDWVTLLTTTLPAGETRAQRDPDGHLMLLEGVRARPHRLAARQQKSRQADDGRRPQQATSEAPGQ